MLKTSLALLWYPDEVAINKLSLSLSLFEIDEVLLSLSAVLLSIWISSKKVGGRNTSVN